MAESLLRQHALYEFLERAPKTDGGVCIEILGSLNYLNLRGRPDNNGFLTLVRQHLGQDLPLVANTLCEGPNMIYWLGPDEWLVVSPINDPGSFQASLLIDELSGLNATGTVLNGGFVTLRVAYDDGMLLLAKGCTLDLNDNNFKPGSCAQTGLAKAPVLIGRRGDGSFDIIVRRSFAEYLGNWLAHSAEEYGGSLFSTK